MTDIEKIQEQYTEEAFDPKQPFLREVYHLAKHYGNDYTFGSKVRELIQKFEKVNREKVQLVLDEQLKNILENGQA